MERDPALVVWLVDAGSMLHQKGHHVNIVIYACLREDEERREKKKDQATAQKIETRSMVCLVCLFVWMQINVYTGWHEP